MNRNTKHFLIGAAVCTAVVIAATRGYFGADVAKAARAATFNDVIDGVPL